MLQSMGPQRAGPDLVTEQQQQHVSLSLVQAKFYDNRTIFMHCPSITLGIL